MRRRRLSESANCMTGWREVNFWVKRQRGSSSVPWPLARASRRAASFTESGSPESSASSSTMSSQALVESSTFSANFLVFRESWASISAYSGFTSSGRSAPLSRKSASVSWMKRCLTGERSFNQSQEAAAFSTVHRRGFNGTEEEKATTSGSISPMASLWAGSSLTESRCMMRPQPRCRSSEAFSRAPKVLS